MFVLDIVILEEIAIKTEDAMPRTMSYMGF